MAKQDVLDAINATIAPNNIKGITAESLNNVLTMMTENAGEGGSGDGALRVIVPELMVLGKMIVETGELSPSSWAAMRPELEGSFGGIDLSEYEEVVNSSFAHNANVAQQIIEKGKAGQGVSVVLDQTPYLPATFNLMLQVEPEQVGLYEDFAACGVQPAGLFMQYINATPEGEAIEGGDVFECELMPAGYINIGGIDTSYPSNMLIILNLDGSLLFEVIEEEQPSSGSGVVTFYLGTPTETMDGPTTLTSEQQAHNAQMYAKLSQLSVVPVVATDVSDMMSKNAGVRFSATMISTYTAVVNDDIAQQMGEEQGFVSLDVDGRTVNVVADGSVTVMPTE